MLQPTTKTDLHIHTAASDGTWEPERLILEIKQAGIGFFAVTDHDTTAGVPTVQKQAREEGLVFIPGVEVSSTYQGELFHILGYGINLAHQPLLELLRSNTDMMIQKDDNTILMLIENGYSIDFQDYLKYEDVSGRGGWKALNYLIETGVCRDVGDFFKRIFNGDRKMPFPIFQEPREVIAEIQDAGGVPVLAHPAGNMNGMLDLQETLENFRLWGIQGIECYHPEHTPEKARFCVEWCLEKGLDITGGSDCHGDFITRRRLGLPDITIQQLKLERLQKWLINFI